MLFFVLMSAKQNMSSASSLGSVPSVRKRASNGFQREQKARAEARYRAAVELYATTDLSLREICRRTEVPESGFSAHIRRHHRDLLLKRNGIVVGPASSVTVSEGGIGAIRLRSNGPGQSLAAREKYRAAVSACLEESRIVQSVSEIAREFGLSATGLGNQLRAHYPEVSKLRERERARRGLGDNLPRGARRYSVSQYAGAVELLRSRTDLTVPEAARLYGVSVGGLRQHLSYYHRDVLALRSARRRTGRGQGVSADRCEARSSKRPCGEEVATPVSKRSAQYAEALELYRTTHLPVGEICRRTGVNVSSFRYHLRRWHPDAQRPA